MFVFSVKDGEFRQFKGSRKVKDFLDFVEEKQWESVEPITSWQNPGSIQMGILGKLINLFIQYLIDWSIYLLINYLVFQHYFFLRLLFQNLLCHERLPQNFDRGLQIFDLGFLCIFYFSHHFSWRIIRIGKS